MRLGVDAELVHHGLEVSVICWSLWEVVIYEDDVSGKS